MHQNSGESVNCVMHQNSGECVNCVRHQNSGECVVRGIRTLESVV